MKFCAVAGVGDPGPLVMIALMLSRIPPTGTTGAGYNETFSRIFLSRISLACRP
jgi:hypothetical protein